MSTKVRRHARLMMSEEEFAQLHHLAVDLAGARGLRRLAVGDLLREALQAFLAAHGRVVSQEVARNG